MYIGATYHDYVQANTPGTRKMMGHPFVFFFTSPQPSHHDRHGPRIRVIVGADLPFCLLLFAIVVRYRFYVHALRTYIGRLPARRYHSPPINFVNIVIHLAHLLSRTCFFIPFGPELGVIAVNATPTRAEQLAPRRPATYPPVAPSLINAALSAFVRARVLFLGGTISTFIGRH
jgi:hypothetical protein